MDSLILGTYTSMWLMDMFVWVGVHVLGVHMHMCAHACALWVDVTAYLLGHSPLQFLGQGLSQNQVLSVWQCWLPTKRQGSTCLLWPLAPGGLMHATVPRVHEDATDPDKSHHTCTEDTVPAEASLQSLHFSSKTFITEVECRQPKGVKEFLSDGTLEI